MSDSDTPLDRLVGETTPALVQTVSGSGGAQQAALGVGVQINYFYPAADGSPAVAIPARTMDSLPRDVPDFTNREAELARIQPGHDGAASAVYAIDGMPGVGKTALAVHAARRLAQNYPDARLFLDLHAHSYGREPVEPGAALDSLLRVLGMEAEQIPDSLDGRVALWRSQLAGKRALVVLDNAVDDEQVWPLLPATPECLVLVTSRRRLLRLDGAATISLDVLAVPQAVSLFARIVGSDRAATDPDCVRDLVGHCGHLPLAIRLAAARLHHHPVWSVRDLATELDQAEDGLGVIQVEAQGMTAVFDLSYGGLNPDQQRIFRRLGLHPNVDFSAFAAAALDDSDVARVRPVLEELYEHHLLDEPQYGRYALHDLLHTYARRLVEETEPHAVREQAVDRLLDYYTFVALRVDELINLLGWRDQHVDWVPRSTPPLTSHAQAIQFMTTERENLFACVKLAMETGRLQRAARLVHAMVYFLRLKGYWTDVLELCRATATVFDAVGDVAGSADMSFYCGDILRLTGRHSEALLSYENSLTEYRELGDGHRAARALHSIGDIERARRRYDDALARYEDALAAYRELGSHLAEARALHSIADTYRLASRHEEARGLYERVLPKYEQLDDKIGEIRVRHSIDDLNRFSGLHDEALTGYRRALRAYGELGDRLGEADAYHSMGEVFRATMQHSDALRHYEDALSAYESLGDRHGEFRTFMGIAAVRRRTGDVQDALAAYALAVGASRVLGDVGLEADAHQAAGEALVEAGRVDEGVPHLQRALTILDSLGSPKGDEVRRMVTEITGGDGPRES